jgi:hypothetical protein
MAQHRVCPWWIGYLAASPIRKWRQNPTRIHAPYVRADMWVLEPGPDMGFFHDPDRPARGPLRARCCGRRWTTGSTRYLSCKIENISQRQGVALLGSLLVRFTFIVRMSYINAICSSLPGSLTALSFTRSSPVLETLNYARPCMDLPRGRRARHGHYAGSCLRPILWWPLKWELGLGAAILSCSQAQRAQEFTIWCTVKAESDIVDPALVASGYPMNAAACAGMRQLPKAQRRRCARAIRSLS